MFGFLKIDHPALPGDAIDGLKGDEFNRDSSGKQIAVTMDARYVGDYRVDPGHYFPDVTQQLFEKDKVPSSATPTMGPQEDNGSMTSFVVDDFSVVIEGA